MPQIQWVLHAHLPYVSPSQNRYSFEYDWFFEALTETYLPLIRMLQGFHKRNIKNVLTLSLSPTLMKMMSHEYFLEQYWTYIEEHCLLAEQYTFLNRSHKKKMLLGQYYIDFYSSIKQTFSLVQEKGLLESFADLARDGIISLITTAMTHAYLPLWVSHPHVIEQQIGNAVDFFEEHIGLNLKGFWLPECGYDSQLEPYLSKHNISYFFIESHGLLQGNPPPKTAIFKPVLSLNDLLVFPRDTVSCQWIWSAEKGYPGAFAYCDFYRDLSLEHDFSLLDQYHCRRGTKTLTGIKSFRIGYDGSDSLGYDAVLAKKLAQFHAHYFILSLEKRFQLIQKQVEEPLITLCFDAELFGHWWKEGMYFLKNVLEMQINHPFFQSASSEKLLIKKDSFLQVQPHLSSWGLGGYHRMWLNSKNDWVFRDIQKILKMIDQNPLPENLEKERNEHMMMVLSSDWIFMISTGNNQKYASERVSYHLKKIKDITLLVG